MTKLFRSLVNWLLCVMALGIIPVTGFALDSQELPDIKPEYVSIKITEPVKRVGYTVGDVIERKVVLTVKAPYKLMETSLPIPGYEKRYRGQLIGIELKSIQHSKEEREDKTTHDITLAYQIFTNNVVAKPAALGPEYLHLINTKNHRDVVKYRVPSLGIAVSPIAIFGQVKIENDMSQFRGPLLLSSSNEKQWLKIAIAALALSLLGLLYILGTRAWLPRMGGAFAKAYRKIRKLPASPEGLKQATVLAHEALNATAKMSVFSNNVDVFLTNNPNFSPLKSELQQFFSLSRQLYFEPNATPSPNAHPHVWLKGFVRQCRDCERGLMPDTSPSRAKA